MWMKRENSGSPPSGDARPRPHQARFAAAVANEAKHRTDAAAAPADILVIFGCTGDLARVMTFHSLYRLEARGPLSCPILGVAVEDWSNDDLRQRARESI